MESSAPSPAPGVVIAEPVPEKNRMDQLEKKVRELIQDNDNLREQNDLILNSIKRFAPFLGDDYHWLKIDKVCLTGSNPKMNDNPFSGELTSELDMKKRMITQNYWGCYLSEDGRCYYTPAKWKYIIPSLVPVPLDKEEKSVFYIRIPKIDMANNKEGLGKLNEYQDKKYHGKEKECENNHRNDSRTDKINHMKITDTNYHKFIIRRGPLRNAGWDRIMTDTCRRILPYIGECDNIQIPVEYYCTNCKCIEEGVGFKMYQCIGH